MQAREKEEDNPEMVEHFAYLEANDPMVQKKEFKVMDVLLTWKLMTLWFTRKSLQ